MVGVPLVPVAASLHAPFSQQQMPPTPHPNNATKPTTGGAATKQPRYAAQVLECPAAHRSRSPSTQNLTLSTTGSPPETRLSNHTPEATRQPCESKRRATVVVCVASNPDASEYSVYSRQGRSLLPRIRRSSMYSTGGVLRDSVPQMGASVLVTTTAQTHREFVCLLQSSYECAN